MLTLANALAVELSRRDPEVRRMVSFTMTEDADPVSYVDGEDHLFGYPPSVERVTGSSIDLDLWTREVSSGGFDVVMRDDGVTRQLLAFANVIGKLVTIRIGTPNVDEAEWLIEWCGVVQNFRPQRDGTIVFECADGLSYLGELTFSGGFINTHLLECARQILEESLPEDLWNMTGFDFEADTTRSHWSISRWEELSLVWTPTPIVTDIADVTSALAQVATVLQLGKQRRKRGLYYRTEALVDGLFTEPRGALDLVREIATVLGGTLRLDSDGRIEYMPYDGAASAVRHWTPAEYFDWEQDGAPDLVNRVNVEVDVGAATAHSILLATSGGYPKPNPQHVIAEDTTAQGLVRTESATAPALRIIERPISTDWVRALGRNDGTVLVGDSTIDIERATVVGFSGARYRFGFRGATTGGIEIDTSSITGNVMTINTVDPHRLETGAWIMTEDLTFNVTAPAQVTVVDADTLTVPRVAADTPTNGGGWIAPQQDPLDTLADGRVAYFLLMNPGLPDQPYEIVRATEGEPAPGVDPFADVRGDSADNLYSGPATYRYAISRHERGTTAAEWPDGGYVWDITMAVAMADQRVARHAYGVPTVTLKTTLAEIAVQVGDFVSHEAEMFTAYTADGLIEGAGETEIFEVIRKNVDQATDPPCIEWTLAFVRSDA